MDAEKISQLEQQIESLTKQVGDLSVDKTSSFQLNYPLDNISRGILDDKTKDIRNYKLVRSMVTDTVLKISAETDDAWIVTALASALTINGPSGNPTNFQPLLIRIKDNGTARALTWNGLYRAGTTALPTTTTVNKTMYLGFFYNEQDTKWDLVAYADNF